MPFAKHGNRVVALVGPYQSGKTSLLESILVLNGAANRRGKGERIVGDQAPEAKAHDMGVEVNVATASFMDDDYTFLDCPGNLELGQEVLSVLAGIDAAVFVVEPESDKLLGLWPIMKVLEQHNIPRFIFVNKIDKAEGSIQDLAQSLQKISSTPLVLRHIPMRDGNEITGYVDLASERAFVYEKAKPSTMVDLPDDEADRVEMARYTMLETLADFDDKLMEELLEDIHPPADEVFTDLKADLAEGLVVPVFMGSALEDHGVFRLMKALRHEAPGIAGTQTRLDVNPSGGVVARVLKTFHTSHAGKLSLARILRGSIKDGDTLDGTRISGMVRLQDDKPQRISAANEGDLVAFGRMDNVHTGDTLGGSDLPELETLSPVYSMALSSDNRSDEVKLATSLQKLHDEDPSLSFEQTEDTHELLIHGQGDVHLKLALERLKSKYGLSVSISRPLVPYKETIRKGKQQHSRYKKQSGGHGQFGDVVIEITPLPLGSGFTFDQKIHGGSVPRQYIPSVEHGIRDYMVRGPLGFNVVDIGVTLLDGKYHAVDSSDMAFQMAGKQAMVEAMPDCSPVLLEPIMNISVFVPSEFTSKINSVISTRRGQILGFDSRAGWEGWDQLDAHMPQSEAHDLIIELRSLTLGAATYTQQFDHLAELTGRLADQVLAQRQAAQ